jgi:uncharacterized RDD family membrane protein YckC
MQPGMFAGQMSGLPDPETEADFYEGVPARRAAAWVVDVLVTLAIGVPVALLFGIFTLGFGFAVFPLVLSGTGLLYRTSTIASGSATWGMRFMGIELRRHDGARLDATRAFLHSLIYGGCMMLFPLQIISCISILTTRYRQGLPDLALGTTAVNRPVP